MNSKVKFITVKNTLPTAKEPYNGAVLHNKTVTRGDLVDEMCKGSLVARPQDADVVLAGIAAAIAEAVGVELLRVNAGGITFEPAISGSVASVDAPLTGDNAIYVNIRVSEAVKSEIGAIVPSADRNAGEAAIAPRIDSVEDVATHTKGVIVGKTKFVVAGKNLFCGASGEQVCLKRSDGSVVYCETIDNDESGTGERIYARVAEDQSAEAGVYTLVVKTFGGATGGGRLVEVSRTVEVK